MIEHCPRSQPQLAPPHRRNWHRIELDACRVHIAWSRSVSTLADKPVRFGHANEVDKWVHEATSSEANPLKLFTDRFKEFARYKRLLEGTPTIHGQSRIEAARLTSTDCRLHVPCPHCCHYQTLRMEQIAWSKPEDDETDKIELARQTAHYVCESCQGEILDSHRPTMLRHGVWCPAGCEVNDQLAAAAARRWQQRLDESNWYGELTAKAKGADDETLWRGWQHADWIIGTPRAAIVSPATNCPASTRPRSPGATSPPNSSSARAARPSCRTSATNGSARPGNASAVATPGRRSPNACRSNTRAAWFPRQPGSSPPASMFKRITAGGSSAPGACSRRPGSSTSAAPTRSFPRTRAARSPSLTCNACRPTSSIAGGT